MFSLVIQQAKEMVACDSTNDNDYDDDDVDGMREGTETQTHTHMSGMHPVFWCIFVLKKSRLRSTYTHALTKLICSA